MRLLSADVFVIKEELIYHYGDVNLRDIMRKYYRYGKSLRVLKNTPYSFMTSVSRKKRRICVGGLKGRLILYSLYLVRGIPFLVGKFS
nr:hypothetical protein [Sulfolobus islandicus]